MNYYSIRAFFASLVIVGELYGAFYIGHFVPLGWYWCPTYIILFFGTPSLMLATAEFFDL